MDRKKDCKLQGCNYIVHYIQLISNTKMLKRSALGLPEWLWPPLQELLVWVPNANFCCHASTFNQGAVSQELEYAKTH